MAITDLDKYKSFIQEGQAGYESTPGQLGIVDPGIRYDPRQHSYAHDLYSYYLGGGMPPAGATGTTAQVSGTTAQGTGGGGAGITAAGVPIPVMPPMGDVGRMPTVPAGGMEGGVWGPQDYLQPTTPIIQDPMTGDASIAEAIAAQDRQDAFNQQFAFEDAKTQQLRPTAPVTGIEGPPSIISGPQVTVPGDLMMGDTLGYGMDEVTPTDALTTGTALDAFSPVNRQQHFDNTQKLREAVGKPGGIDLDTYHRLSAYDSTQTMGLGPVTGAAAALGYQGVQTVMGEQGIGKMMEDTGKNIMGVSGKISPADKQAYDRIIHGAKSPGPGIYAMKEQEKPTADLADWGSPMGGVPDPTVVSPRTIRTESTALTPTYRDPIMDYADTGIDSRIADMGPTMADVAGPVQNITTPSGDTFAANDPPLLEKVDPETRENTNMIAGLWDKAKGSASDFKNSLVDSGKFTAQQILSLGNVFAQGPNVLNLSGAAGFSPATIVPLIIGALAGARTQVTPEDSAANTAFEQRNEISIGDDGRITSGPLQGLNPAGKSFAGSANYNEMVDKKIADIKNRKAPQTDASRAKIAELEAMKTTKAAPTGIMKPGGYDEVPEEAIPTEAEEDETDLMTFEQLGGWLGRDDRAPDEPTPTGIEGPPSIISPEPAGPTGPDPHGGFAAPITREGGDASVAEAIAAENRAAEKAAVQEAVSKQIAASRGNGGSDPAPSAPSGSTARGGPSYGPHGGASYGPHGGGGGGGGGGCFLPNTPITMADGTEKPVKDVDIGDKVAKGGKVFATGKFLVENLYDYKGIKVSGSHMVNEDGKWTRIEDSKHGKSLGDDEHIVYVFGAEHRRILIKGILFTDYFELPEQEQLDKNGDAFFINWKEYAEKANDQIVKILNAS